MKNMLVTGGYGFIGTNFIQYLLEESDYGGRIINVDNLTYAANPQNLAHLARRFSDRYVFIHANICSRETMAEVFDRFHIDTICHFAAESHVDRSIVQPDAFMHTNILGTFTLLELARERKARIELFHHISTDEVFGSLGDEGYFDEQTAYKPNSPYSASKAASDHLVRAYHTTYGIPVTISTCSNNYGPYQFPEKLIPLMIINARDYKPLPVYGDGRNVRDWLFVLDHCTAIWRIMKQGKRGETYAIGGNNELENIALVEMICDIVDERKRETARGPRQELITFVADRPGHDRRYAIDATKIRTHLNWKPMESFQTGIRKTVTWYLENRQWIDHIQSGEYQRWIETNYTRRGEV
ncbi:MAG: dTDP-glucose 4,6-dehydratase [Deltaproteobacteria bacterium]|nr:dTDP-glucose 4,6-dehydratase [Deltaproteobacteria bacterium]